MELVSWLVGWWVRQLVSCLVSWLVGWLVLTMVEMRKIPTILPETQHKLQDFTSVAEELSVGMPCWLHSTEILVTGPHSLTSQKTWILNNTSCLIHSLLMTELTCLMLSSVIIIIMFHKSPTCIVSRTFKSCNIWNTTKGYGQKCYCDR